MSTDNKIQSFAIELTQDTIDFIKRHYDLQYSQDIRALLQSIIDSKLINDKAQEET